MVSYVFDKSKLTDKKWKKQKKNVISRCTTVLEDEYAMMLASDTTQKHTTQKFYIQSKGEKNNWRQKQ